MQILWNVVCLGRRKQFYYFSPPTKVGLPLLRSSDKLQGIRLFSPTAVFLSKVEGYILSQVEPSSDKQWLKFLTLFLLKSFFASKQTQFSIEYTSLCMFKKPKAFSPCSILFKIFSCLVCTSLYQVIQHSQNNLFVFSRALKVKLLFKMFLKCVKKYSPVKI